MATYNMEQYAEMFGNIPEKAINSAACMSQCTGCKCSCKCSCKGINVTEDVWEEF